MNFVRALLPVLSLGVLACGTDRLDKRSWLDGKEESATEDLELRGGTIPDDPQTQAIGAFLSPLEVKNVGTVYVPYCTGTAISAREILTAAHCVADEKGPLRFAFVRLATQDQAIPLLTRDSSFVGYNPPAARTFFSTSIRIHPSYDPATVTNDLAIVTFDKDFPVTPLKFVPTEWATLRDFFIAGYGYSAPTKASGVTIQNFGILTYAKAPGPLSFADDIVTVTSTTRQAATCRGDSGGPLLAKVGTSLQVMGVLSTGDAVACELNRHSNYTDLNRHQEFLAGRSLENQISEWTNPSNRHDVNRDGQVTPLDALVIINYANANRTARPTPGEKLAMAYDVSGDGKITPLDALMVINKLNTSKDAAQTTVGFSAARYAINIAKETVQAGDTFAATFEINDAVTAAVKKEGLTGLKPIASKFNALGRNERWYQTRKGVEYVVFPTGSLERVKSKATIRQKLRARTELIVSFTSTYYSQPKRMGLGE